jgi:hypothetical protein
MSSRVTKTDALHPNQSPTPQPSYQMSRSTVAITAYLLMLDPLSSPSDQRRLVGSRQTSCWLSHSAAVLRLFPDADQTTRMHPNPEAVRIASAGSDPDIEHLGHITHGCTTCDTHP